MNEARSLALFVSLVAVGCSAPQALPAASTPATSPPLVVTTIAPLNDGAARHVATVVKLVDAYNAGNLDGVLALLAPEVAAWADCAGTTFVAINGPTFRFPVARADVAPYLRARFADHDRLEIGSITADPSMPVVGIQWAIRSNDSLRALGFASGVLGPGTNKTVFDDNGLVRAFANASGPQDCKLPAAVPASPVEASCAVTVPATSLVPSITDVPVNASRFSWFGSTTLAVNLPNDGTYRIQTGTTPGRARVAWWRSNGEIIDVSAERIDATAALVQTRAPPLEGGQGQFVPAEIVFTANGCWRVSAKTPTQTLTFVMRIRQANPGEVVP